MSDGKKLIASILETGSTQTLRLIDRSLFEENEQALYDYVHSHFSRYGVLPDIGTVESDTRKRLPATDEPVAYYLKKVRDRKLFVLLREGFGDLRESLQRFDTDAAKELIGRLNSSCRTSSPDNDLRSVAEAAEEVLSAYMDAHASPGLSGITTGFPSIDETTGGYQNGDLVSWVARMGVGKTMVLIHQARAARRAGHSVLFVTMEMTITQIVRRYLSMETGVASSYIRKGTLSSSAQQKLSNYVEEIRRADKMNFYAGAFSKSSNDIDTLITELSPDIGYVDGAYLMSPANITRSASRIDKVAAVFGDLKRMTISHDRPIVCSTQFSRAAGSKGKDGSLETISFSDSIAQNSSLVFGIKEGKPPNEKARRAITTMKGREGEHAEMEINYRFAPTDFSEVQPEQEAAEGADTQWMQ